MTDGLDRDALEVALAEAYPDVSDSQDRRRRLTTDLRWLFERMVAIADAMGDGVARGETGPRFLPQTHEVVAWLEERPGASDDVVKKAIEQLRVEGGGIELTAKQRRHVEELYHAFAAKVQKLFLAKGVRFDTELARELLGYGL